MRARTRAGTRRLRSDPLSPECLPRPTFLDSIAPRESTQFGVGVLVLPVKRANHAGFADGAADRTNLAAPFEEGASAEARNERNQKEKR